MTPTWAQRREAVLRDCIVSLDVFHQMMDRLDEFVVLSLVTGCEHLSDR